jgi:hypothetical protein
MSTKELLEIVVSRGLKIRLVDGRPVLVRAHGSPAVTDNLLSVLRFHRERIIDHLKRESGEAL